MTILGIVLVIGGVAALLVGLMRIRAPLAMVRELDERQANLERYETWRGRHTGVDATGPTGADEMRSLLRRQAMKWGGLCAIGLVAVFVGLLSR
jgi:hypothetical protein